MKLISELERSIKTHIKLDKRHLKTFTCLIIGLMTLNTVNLAKLAKLGFDDSQSTSRYRKLQRFLAKARFDYGAISKLIFHLFDFDCSPQYLTMDRTNWSLGSFEINILFLCIEWHGCAIPVIWLLLPHKGNSATKHRIALLNRFTRLFGKSAIKRLLADREFIGGEWFAYLVSQGIPFCIRVKKDADTTNARGKGVQVGWLCHHLKPGERMTLSGARRLYGQLLTISAAKSPDDGQLMIVASNVSDDGVEHYLNRWPIECLFGCLKGKGFNFELTRLVHRVRIKKLVALLALSYC
ncbi:MAG: hypothetical protein COV52_00260, partial [Gammaproteobacteria bacterium CG11_big_fil_rev_8_21_14_0_20_46_22]